MYVLGLTGGIASGKSTVANYLQTHHIPVLDADVIAHEITVRGQTALTEIEAAFGETVFYADGSLNRSALADRVFHDADALATLNAITHPKVFARMQAQLELLDQQKTPLAVLDIPLLFENAGHMTYDATMVVTVSPEVQLARLMRRNQLTKDQAQARIDAQMPLADKVKRADFVIENGGSLQDTYRQVDTVLKRLAQ